MFSKNSSVEKKTTIYKTPASRNTISYSYVFIYSTVAISTISFERPASCTALRSSVHLNSRLWCAACQLLKQSPSFDAVSELRKGNRTETADPTSHRFLCNNRTDWTWRSDVGPCGCGQRRTCQSPSHSTRCPRDELRRRLRAATTEEWNSSLYFPDVVLVECRLIDGQRKPARVANDSTVGRCFARLFDVEPARVTNTTRDGT